MSRVGLALLLLVLAAAPFAEAEERVTYEVPPDIAAVIADENERTLATTALATLELHGPHVESARALLVQLGDVGLKAVAERLARGDVPARMLPPLIDVIGTSRHPDADALLGTAAREARPLVRMVAADGLGRGRSPRAVPLLAALARDAVPGVRIAALRSLFAIESPQAIAARVAVPADREVALLAKRLRWHRRCRDASPALRTVAQEAYLASRSVPLRTAAAHYLTLPQVDAPIDLLETIVTETGQGPFFAAHIRRQRGVPVEGYDHVAMRQIAIDAVLTLLDRPATTSEQRARWIERAVWWVARPVALNARLRDPTPENVLRRRLPGLGAEIIAPVVRRLKQGHFAEPRPGVILLRELGPELALPILHDFLEPRAERPAFESRAEAEQRRYLRNAAAGALDELAQVGDEALARALLLGDESRTLKTDIVYALRGDPGSWAIPLLNAVRKGDDPDLRSTAISILERRSDEAARAILVEDLFEKVENPHQRLQALVRRGDDPAYEVLERALKDQRVFLRKAALSRFNRKRNPRLSGTRARKVLAGFTPDATNRLEIQAYVYALLNVDAAAAVTYVRERWDGLPSDGLRMTLLRILGEAHGKEAREGAIDLALAKASGQVSAPMQHAAAAVFMGPAAEMRGAGYEWSYRSKEVGAFWRGLLFSDDSQLQREAIAAYTQPKAPNETARLLALLDRALEGKALGERDTTPEGEASYASDVIDALALQPWEAVEEKFIDVATATYAAPDVRVRAAHQLMGRLSEPSRARIMDWLAYTKPEPQDGPPSDGFNSPDMTQLFLAAAVGEGANEATAATLFAALKRELFGFYSPQVLQRLLRNKPAAVGEANVRRRVGPLARAISRTKHVPSVLAMLDLVFDLRFAVYAQVCAKRQAEVARAADAGAAASVPSPRLALSHDDGTPYWGMPFAVNDIIHEVKYLDDETLAAGFERVLGAARDDGRLASFPELFLYRVHQKLLDAPTGRKPASAAVVRRFVRDLGTPYSAIKLQVLEKGANDLASRKRFADAAAVQQEVLRIVARGSHDERQPGLWTYHRALLDALEGAAAVQRNETADASSRFLRAVLRAPNDPDVLNTVAWYRARVGFSLDQAEREALYATTLEARVDNRPGPNAADTLAYVLLRSGRPEAGLRVLAPQMNKRSTLYNALLHYHMAQLQAATKRWRSARDSLVHALTWDRILIDEARVEPLFKPLFAKQSLASISKLAEAARLEQRLPP